ncbi:tetratricopeptide repeat protein [bacterium]|nr:tetratricopeptide repeat protein [bacterium]MCI0603782.1 tetratricopeptide repeat protein [bacterium]
MSKDNLIFALAGMVIGVILGVLIANSNGPRQVVSAPGPQEMTTSSNQSTAPQEQGQLPDGHPPIDESALKSRIAEQQEILKKDPNNQEATVSIANLNFDLKNYYEAIQWYEKALVRDPSNIDLITDLGTSHMWMGEYQKAIDLYNKSLSINPKHLQSLMNLGIARMSLGDRAGAAEMWEKVITFYPNHPEVPMLKQAITKLRTEKS